MSCDTKQATIEDFSSEVNSKPAMLQALNSGYQKCLGSDVCDIHFPWVGQEMSVQQLTAMFGNIVNRDIQKNNMISPQSAEGQTCNFCSSALATGGRKYVYCLDCQEFYCEGCNSTHTKFGFALSHRVIWSGSDTAEDIQSGALIHEAERFCSIHEAEPEILYCRRCDKPICDICYCEEHAECDEIDAIGEAAEEANLLLQVYLGKIQERICHANELLDELEHEKRLFKMKTEKEMDNLELQCKMAMTPATHFADRLRLQLNSHLNKRLEEIGNDENVGIQNIAECEIVRDIMTQCLSVASLSDIMAIESDDRVKAFMLNAANNLEKNALENSTCLTMIQQIFDSCLFESLTNVEKLANKNVGEIFGFVDEIYCKSLNETSIRDQEVNQWTGERQTKGKTQGEGIDVDVSQNCNTRNSSGGLDAYERESSEMASPEVTQTGNTGDLSGDLSTFEGDSPKMEKYCHDLEVAQAGNTRDLQEDLSTCEKVSSEIERHCHDLDVTQVDKPCFGHNSEANKVVTECDTVPANPEYSMLGAHGLTFEANDLYLTNAEEVDQLDEICSPRRNIPLLNESESFCHQDNRAMTDYHEFYKQFMFSVESSKSDTENSEVIKSDTTNAEADGVPGVPRTRTTCPSEACENGRMCTSGDHIDHVKPWEDVQYNPDVPYIFLLNQKTVVCNSAEMATDIYKPLELSFEAAEFLSDIQMRPDMSPGMPESNHFAKDSSGYRTENVDQLLRFLLKQELEKKENDFDNKDSWLQQDTSNTTEAEPASEMTEHEKETNYREKQHEEAHLTDQEKKAAAEIHEEKPEFNPDQFIETQNHLAVMTNGEQDNKDYDGRAKAHDTETGEPSENGENVTKVASNTLVTYKAPDQEDITVLASDETLLKNVSQLNSDENVPLEVTSEVLSQKVTHQTPNENLLMKVAEKDLPMMEIPDCKFVPLKATNQVPDGKLLKKKSKDFNRKFLRGTRRVKQNLGSQQSSDFANYFDSQDPDQSKYMQEEISVQEASTKLKNNPLDFNDNSNDSGFFSGSPLNTKNGSCIKGGTFDGTGDPLSTSMTSTPLSNDSRGTCLPCLGLTSPVGLTVCETGVEPKASSTSPSIESTNMSQSPGSSDSDQLVLWCAAGDVTSESNKRVGKGIIKVVLRKDGEVTVPEVRIEWEEEICKVANKPRALEAFDGLDQSNGILLWDQDGSKVGLGFETRGDAVKFDTELDQLIGQMNTLQIDYCK